MLILMKPQATPAQWEAALDRVRELGFRAHPVNSGPRPGIVVAASSGNVAALDPAALEGLDGIADVVGGARPYPLAGLGESSRPSTVRVGAALFGPGHLTVVAGPCAVESEEQTLRIARAVKAAGAGALRGGAFKPRTSPYSFQGLGREGLAILEKARAATGLPVITEAVDEKSLEWVVASADAVQIGARNMQNFSLLQRVGRCGKPVLLKRGLSATVDEWLQAAEYILSEGNPDVILCERGVRSFDPHARNLLDLAAVAALRLRTHLPVIVDPSHGTGRREMVSPMARAAVAAGADGVMLDVHDRPDEALCDGPQAISPAELTKLVPCLGAIAEVVR